MSMKDEQLSDQELIDWIMTVMSNDIRPTDWSWRLLRIVRMLVISELAEKGTWNSDPTN